MNNSLKNIWSWAAAIFTRRGKVNFEQAGGEMSPSTPQKPFLLMSVEEKAGLLFAAFPDQVSPFLSFAYETAQTFIRQPERFRKLRLKSIGEFGWQNLAIEMEAAIRTEGPLMERKPRYMAKRLFAGWDSIFAQYCLFEFKNKRGNRRFAHLVNRMFALS